MTGTTKASVSLSEKVRVVNVKGLHARASAKLVNMVAALPADVEVLVVKDDAEAVGGSILGLMMLGAGRGDEIEIRVAGHDAAAVEAALARVVGLVMDGFGED